MADYHGKNALNEGGEQLARAASKGKVKWFSGVKGYGFVALDSGGDAFCHASVLLKAGHSELPTGATVECELAEGTRGLKVAAIHKVDLSTAAQPPRWPIK